MYVCMFVCLFVCLFVCVFASLFVFRFTIKKKVLTAQSDVGLKQSTRLLKNKPPINYLKNYHE